MAYINKVSAIVVAVLFLAVAVAPSLAQEQPPPPAVFPRMDPICATVMPDLLEKCFATFNNTPTEECCSDLKTATTTQVTCLCDNYIANPATVNITGPYSAGITTKCGVFDKYSCNGTSKGEKEAEPIPKVDPVCSTVIEDLLGNCLKSGGKPSEACCNDLKSATKKQVTCVCDMAGPKQGSSNLTKSTDDSLPNLCGVADKFSCINQGATNKVSASMAVFGFVATLFFVMF